MNRRLLPALLVALAVLALPAAPPAASAPLRTAPALLRVSALEVNATAPDTASAVSSAPPKITARVAVMETTGVPVAGLPADAFAVSEDGRPIKNITVEARADSAEPLAAVLALDTSGSMVQPSPQPLADMKAAARTFLDTLGPSDTVAAFGFGGGVPRDLAWNPDRNAVYGMVNSLTGQGITPLWDAVYAAITLAADQPAGRRTVLVMTDGEDEGNTPNTPGSIKRVDDVITLARDRNTPVFAVALGKGQTAALQRLAETSGGLFLGADRSAELPARFAEVAAALRKEYVLSYEGAAKNEDSERELAITVSLRGDTATATRRYAVPHTIARRVSVRFTTPAQGQEVRGEMAVEAEVLPAESARSVEFFLEGQPIGASATAPWTATWTPKGVANGDKKLRVRATGIDGAVVEQEITVRLIQPKEPTNWGVAISFVLLVMGAIGAAIYIGVRRLPATVVAGAGAAAKTVAPLWQPAAVAVGAGVATGGLAGGGARPAAAAPMLVEVRPDGTRWTWPLQPNETLIGREVEPPHILLDDPDVSRLHGTIRLADGQARYEEFSPTNAARINGRPYSGSWLLADGDEIQIGETRLIFRETGQG